jgi:hypothetical protein
MKKTENENRENENKAKIPNGKHLRKGKQAQIIYAFLTTFSAIYPFELKIIVTLSQTVSVV